MHALSRRHSQTGTRREWSRFATLWSTVAILDVACVSNNVFPHRARTDLPPTPVDPSHFADGPCCFSLSVGVGRRRSVKLSFHRTHAIWVLGELLTSHAYCCPLKFFGPSSAVACGGHLRTAPFELCNTI